MARSADIFRLSWSHRSSGSFVFSLLLVRFAGAISHSSTPRSDDDTCVEDDIPPHRPYTTYAGLTTEREPSTKVAAGAGAIKAPLPIAQYADASTVREAHGIEKSLMPEPNENSSMLQVEDKSIFQATWESLARELTPESWLLVSFLLFVGIGCTIPSIIRMCAPAADHSNALRALDETSAAAKASAARREESLPASSSPPAASWWPWASVTEGPSSPQRETVVLPECLPALVRPPDGTEVDTVFFELWDAGLTPNSDHRPFPYSLGPFKLKSPPHIGLTDIIISKPGSSSHGAWTLAIESHHSPAMKRIRTRETDIVDGNKTICGHLSPYQEINLGIAMKKELGIPACSKWFAWCYPADVLTVDHGTGTDDAPKQLQDFDPDLAFVQTGGYIYCSEDGQLMRILALQQDPHGYLLFGPPKRWMPQWTTEQAAEFRFHPVTLPALRNVGATHFRWAQTNEVVKLPVLEASETTLAEKICPRGGFVYSFEAGVLPADLRETLDTANED